MTKLYDKLNLKMLKDRRKMCMFKIMFKLSRDEENVKSYCPEMTLRTSPKVKMKVALTDKKTVCQSPYYLCN